ncbi:hypothetical protein GF412_03140 [Candidatus Micrarchaeota archaeon]|nr:hypothetical protein [Candidatus Micrarchaeota archaeon]MBD3417948.1 hypothetical protein [Candidatus Micrarchaeota archaeon]
MPWKWQMVRFLAGKEAAVHADAVIISDLHLGMEASLFERGVRASDVSEKLADKTIDVLEETGKKKLIVLGDVKEKVVGVPWEMKKYFEGLEGQGEIIVVKGNHDGGIEKVPGIEVIGAGGFVYRKLGLFHGHAWPSEEVMGCGTVIMGHNHPQAKLAGEWKPVWVEARPEKKNIEKKYPGYNKRIKLILMPSFNPLLGTNIVKSEGLGPVLRNKLFKLNTAIVYTLGGTKIGKLGELFKRL